MVGVFQSDPYDKFQTSWDSCPCEPSFAVKLPSSKHTTSYGNPGFPVPKRSTSLVKLVYWRAHITFCRVATLFSSPALKQMTHSHKKYNQLENSQRILHLMVFSLRINQPELGHTQQHAADGRWILVTSSSNIQGQFSGALGTAPLELPQTPQKNGR